MKTFVAGALLSMGLLSMLAVGCGGVDDGGTIDESIGAEESVRSDDEAITQHPLCQDLSVDEIYVLYCGPQKGPEDQSPVFVRCERTCTTERSISFTVNGPICVTGDTECTAWDCPSCQDFDD